MEWRKVIKEIELNSKITNGSIFFGSEYLENLIQNGSEHYLPNVETTINILQSDDAYMPTTINNEEYESSYVCSPYNAYINYAREELQYIPSRTLRFFLRLTIKLLSILLKFGKINKTICINNWLLSTNIYPNWKAYNIASIQKHIQKLYPKHCLVFRSLNEHSNKSLLEEFRKCDFALLPSRQVYIFDHSLKDYMKKKNLKIDIDLLETNDYQAVKHDDILTTDFPRIAQLYKKLYLDKHSEHNPIFNKKCIELWHQTGFLKFFALRNKEGEIDAVLGSFELNSIITAPLVGYDTDLDQKLGLYRMLIAYIIKKADSLGQTLNLSSGAGDFKRVRGGIPFIEYSAVYTKHLPLFRQLIWHFLIMISNQIIVPIMKAYKL